MSATNGRPPIYNKPIDPKEVKKAIKDLNSAWEEKYQKKVKQLEKEHAKAVELQKAIEKHQGEATSSFANQEQIMTAIAALNKAWGEKYERKVRQLKNGTAKKEDLMETVSDLNQNWKAKYDNKVAQLKKEDRSLSKLERKQIKQAVADLNATWEAKYHKLETRLEEQRRLEAEKQISYQEVRQAVEQLNYAWEDKYLTKVVDLQDKLANAEMVLNNPENVVAGPYARKAKETLKTKAALEEIMEENRRLKAKIATIESMIATE